MAPDFPTQRPGLLVESLESDLQAFTRIGSASSVCVSLAPSVWICRNDPHTVAALFLSPESADVFFRSQG